MVATYGVYDTREDGLCIGIFKGAKAVAERFGMSKGSVYCSVSRGCKIKHRYEVKKLWEER